MYKKKTYMTPTLEVIKLDYQTFITGSNIEIASSNSEEKDWDPEKGIGGEKEYGFE